MKLNLWKVMAVSGLCLVMAGPFAMAENDAPREKREAREKSEKRETREANRKERREKMRERGQEIRKRAAKKLFEGVELTDDQRAQLKAVREKARTDAENWRNANQAKFKELREQMRTARQNDDKEAFEAAKNEARNLMKNAPRPRDYTDQVRGVLNEEQRVVFDQNHEELKQKFEEWREKRAAKWEEMKEKRAEKWKEMKDKREARRESAPKEAE